MKPPTRNPLDRLLPVFVGLAPIAAGTVGYVVAWLLGADHLLLYSAACDAVVPTGIAPPPCPPVTSVPSYRGVDPLTVAIVGVAILALEIAA